MISEATLADLRRSLVQDFADLLTRELARLHAERVAAGAADTLPTLLTQRQAAAELSIGLTKLRLLIRKGEIRTAVLGERVMVPATEIRRLSKPREFKRNVVPERPSKRAANAKSHAEGIRAALRASRRPP